MKKLLLAIYIGLCLMSGCSDKVTETVTFMINEPIFMSAEDFRNSVNVTTKDVPIKNYGKICFYQGYIFIAESGKGIHIINNSNPSNPQKIGFIELIGNADIAIRNGILYADALVDLVWFNINNPATPVYEGRLENVFAASQPLPPIDNEYGYDYVQCFGNDGRNKGIIVGWKLNQRTETVTYTTGGWWGNFEKSENAIMSDGGRGSGTSIGITGSMSRFSQYNNYLYSVINNIMNIIDLSGNEPQKAADDIYIGLNVETIFNYKNNMFIGTPTGMVIYSVANPLKPEFMSFVGHVFGCDPVVVEDDIAYVTIHSGNNCGQNFNELLIYDVSNVKNPVHIVTYAMTRPKGLGIDNGTLFVCDDGLKIFNAADAQTIMANRLAHYSGMEGYDVIPFENVLMMIAEDGLYQYDYSDLNKINLLSKLGFEK